MLGRRFSSFAATLLIAMPGLAATRGSQVRPQVVKPSRFAVSAPARSLPAARPNPNATRPAIWGRENEELPKSQNGVDKGQQDGALQAVPTGGTMPAPDLTIDGIANQENFDTYGFRVFPPDTNGAAGLDQYVQMVNLLVRVWDKTGTPLTPSFQLSSLFGALGGICSTTDWGDPIVLYDQMADRWLLSQFAFGDDGFAPPYHECIAVSVTGDATGAWYTWDFETPGFEFPDYPHLGVWPDGYYMTVNQFYGGGPFDGTGAYAFDRAKMLMGDPSAGLVYFNLDLASHPEGIGGALPSSMDGRTPPAVGEPNVFSYFLADEYGDPVDGLRMFDFHVDWTNPMDSTFTERPESPIVVAPFNPLTPSGRTDIQQPPPAAGGAALDAIGDRLMFRFAYRNFGGHESLVVTHTVNVGTGTTLGTYKAAPRWYELTRNGGAWSVANQGTYAPDTDNRWMGSVAQDNQGNLAIGYSVSSLTTFPSIRYAGRLAADPANTLGQAETSLVAGSGVQTNTNPGSRWGDYSDMAVDPADDCRFWYTNEYYTAASQASSSVGWVTKIGTFKFPSCAAPPAGVLEGQIVNCLNDDPIPGAVVSLGNGYTRVTDGSGNYSFGALPPGGYTVTVTKSGWLAGGGPVNVADGMTTIQDFCLDGVPVIAIDGDATVVDESCLPANGVVDPGETVTVSFCLQNTGGADTTDLVATLLPGGGVLSPSGSQSYGVKTAGGGSVCRDFTFTADPFLACGHSLTATFQLVDGPMNLGQAVFTIPTGALVVGGTEDFDSVTPPALPAGWSTSGTGSTLWETTTDVSQSPPNSALALDDEVSIDKRLDTPIIDLPNASVQLSFQNYYITEEGWDGGVLEIAIDGGPFEDIIDAGGSFVEGGYNEYISPFAASPLAGQKAWTGDSGGYIATTVNLPPAAKGHQAVLRWRLVADDAFTAVGWSIDTISVSVAQCCWAPAPASLAADPPPPPPLPAGGGTSNQNGVIEPGETFMLNPGYYNGGPDPFNQIGIFSNFTGPAGATYTINDGTADYGLIAPGATNTCFQATLDCPVLAIDDPATRPAQHWDTSIQEEQQFPPLVGPAGVSTANIRTWILHVGNSFLDVPDTSIYYRFIETIFHNRITAGCAAGNYCPDSSVTRAQMAVFLLKSEHGAGYLPPACTPGYFNDVACPSLFADWIEQLAVEGITAGCGGGNYCPNDPVTRAQMAVFLLKTEHGSSYLPPACTPGYFNDVACPSQYANWIQQLAVEGVTAGCGGGNYCPNDPNTRAQMAVFLTKTFGLLLYGP
jgi:hypothetical protein